MANTSTQRIRREAMSVAIEEWDERREDWVDRLEDLREEADVQKTHIDEGLEYPRNWYSNRIRGGKHSHDFSLQSYHEVRIYLDEYDGDRDHEQLDAIKADAAAARDDDMAALEAMRDLLDVKIRTLDNFVNRGRGWFVDCVDGEKSIQLHDYVRLEVFLETLLQFAYYTEAVDDDDIDDLIETGAVDGSLFVGM